MHDVSDGTVCLDSNNIDAPCGTFYVDVSVCVDMSGGRSVGRGTCARGYGRLLAWRLRAVGRSVRRGRCRQLPSQGPSRTSSIRSRLYL